MTESTFTIATEIENTNPEADTQETSVSFSDDSLTDPASESLSLEANESETVEFEVDTDDLEAGSVYEYNVSTEDAEITAPGSFYAGYPDTHFEPSDTTAVQDDETVTTSANITNLGLESGSQDVEFELEYLDELPEELEGEDPYGHLGETEINRSFGETDTIDLELNESRLLDGEYESTIHTEDGSDSVEFDVDAGLDPGRVGLSEVENADVGVEVLASQVSGDGTIWSDGFLPSPTTVHNLAPMTLDIRTNGEVEHSFANPENGDNINTGPTWQNKDDESFSYNFTIEDETELTLRNTRHETCQDRSTDPSTIPGYDGPTGDDFMWCSEAPSQDAFGPIDASQDENLQNVRVRSAENNMIPALPAGNEQQQSATEVLEERDLVEEGSDELDLGPGEFVFLFENTESTTEDGIDALWDDAIEEYEDNPHETYDPNFNDLIVYVEVERADVNPGTPSITISPGGGEETVVEEGTAAASEDVDDIDVSLGDGTSESGDGLDIGAGDTDDTTSDSGSDDIGVDVDTDHIVIG